MKNSDRTVIIEMKSKRKFRDPKTPRNLRGFSYWYAQYEAEHDAVRLWGVGAEFREYRDEDDGYWMASKLNVRNDKA